MINLSTIVNGTFQPGKNKKPKPKDLSEAINEAKKNGGKVWAVRKGNQVIITVLDKNNKILYTSATTQQTYSIPIESKIPSVSGDAETDSLIWQADQNGYAVKETSTELQIVFKKKVENQKNMKDGIYIYDMRIDKNITEYGNYNTGYAAYKKEGSKYVFGYGIGAPTSQEEFLKLQNNPALILNK